jgi:hypothetical protein
MRGWDNPFWDIDESASPLAVRAAFRPHQPFGKGSDHPGRRRELCRQDEPPGMVCPSTRLACTVTADTVQAFRETEDS